MSWEQAQHRTRCSVFGCQQFNDAMPQYTWRTTPFFGSSRRRSLRSMPASVSEEAIRSDSSSLYSSTTEIRTCQTEGLS